jgi:hypothetical protein
MGEELELKAQQWMIDPEWLQKEENHKYNTESRIVDSGPDWGEVDPKVQLAKREKLKAEKKVIAGEKKRKNIDKVVRKGNTKLKTNKSRKGVKGKA